ncbi:uncharacterized protein PRD47_013438 isoform 1-T2 [Ara ararauna]
MEPQDSSPIVSYYLFSVKNGFVVLCSVNYGISPRRRQALVSHMHIYDKYILFVMSKLSPSPKDLILHHQSEGKISPELLQEHHEGQAFSLEIKLNSEPSSSSFPERTSSPDGLHAVNYKGNPGSVKVGAKTSLIAAMPGFHQMSGLFIRLGVS